MNQPTISFYDWPYSPFCMKVRAILDYKGLEYQTVSPIGRARSIRRRGGAGKAAAIEIDGELIADSTDIAHALEKRFPDPPIIPEKRRDRALCHALEEWADESLHFVGLYFRWFDKAGRKQIPAKFGKSLKGRLAYRFYLARILGQLRGQGTSRKRPQHVRSDLDRHLAAVEALLDPGPCTLGKNPYLCDFALWAQLEYLRRTPAGGMAMRGKPALAVFLKQLGS